MIDYKKHLITSKTPIKEALQKLDILARDAILFVVDANDKLIGSLTDGDVRRGLLKGITIDGDVGVIIQQNPRFIRKGSRDIHKIIKLRSQNFRILPVIDSADKVITIINFRNLRSYLPIDAIIMAGGRGQRLKPLTDITPKPPTIKNKVLR